MQTPVPIQDDSSELMELIRAHHNLIALNRELIALAQLRVERMPPGRAPEPTSPKQGLSIVTRSA